MEERVDILDVPVDILSASKALDRIIDFAGGIGRNGSVRQVFFVNVHTIYEARRDSTFLEGLRRADLLLPDGSGLSIAGQLLGTPIIENLNGTDLTPRLLGAAEERGMSVYMVGANDAVIQRCKAILESRYPRLRILGARHGYLKGAYEREVVGEINRLKPDIVLVGMGTPLQERWIIENSGFAAKVCLAVGGLFDFLSGEKPRAPRWMRSLGIEWLFRFMLEPRSKWKRIIVEIPWFFGLLGRTVARRRTSRPWKTRDPRSIRS